ncbi:hypothetical protein KKB28_08005, partial [bacterium]|nr:hypothetical protein [bacterium]
MERIFSNLMKRVFSAIYLPGLLLSSIMLSVSFSFAQPSPDTLWTRTFGGEEYDLVFDIKQTSDGGYIIAGETASSEVMGAYLLRLDNDGDSLWMRIYRDEEDIHYFFNAFEVLQTEDGGYILT